MDDCYEKILEDASTDFISLVRITVIRPNRELQERVTIVDTEVILALIV